jgi:flagellar biogenesis protein FliO
MLSRTGLVRDILIVTVCGALWMLVLMGADGDWETAQPATAPLTLPESSKDDAPAKPEAAPKSSPAGGELSLYTDSKTTPTQTKPDDPTEVLGTGVTVAAKSAPPRRAAAGESDRPVKVELLQVSPDKSPAPQVERSAESITSRQASLSYGGDETEVALVDQRTQLKRQADTTKKPVTQPRQFMPRSTPASRAMPPEPVKQMPVRQLPVLSAVPSGGAQKIKIETQVATDQAARPAAAPLKANAQPAAKPVAKPATKTATEAAKPQVLAAKPSTQTAKAAPPVKSPSHETAAKNTQVNKPATLAAAPKPKAQLNGGVRIVTPRHETAQPKAEVATPLSAKPAPALAHHGEMTLAAEAGIPTLPVGEELVTADLLAAAPAVTVPTRSVNETQAQAILPADDVPGQVVIDSVSTAPPVSPTVIVMGILAIAFFALWLWLRRTPTPPTPLTLLQQKAVSVIETITLAPGRQIVLVEVSGNALVLGVTPQSINLLERMPLALLAQNYQPLVEGIIHRESALGVQWAEAPRLAAAGGGAPVRAFSQPRVAGSVTRTSLTELRRQQTARGENLTVVGSKADRD